MPLIMLVLVDVLMEMPAEALVGEVVVLLEIVLVAESEGVLVAKIVLVGALVVVLCHAIVVLLGMRGLVDALVELFMRCGQRRRWCAGRPCAKVFWHSGSGRPPPGRRGARGISRKRVVGTHPQHRGPSATQHGEAQVGWPACCPRGVVIARG